MKRPIEIPYPLPDRITNRFWSKVSKAGESDCWLWTGSTSRGYGRLRVSGTQVAPAHRVSYQAANGDLMDGMEIDHICRNRGCVNPKHLRQVTRKQNSEHLAPVRRINENWKPRGVWRVERRSGPKYVVQVKHNYEIHCGGTYDDLDQAVAAAESLRARLFSCHTTTRR